MSTTPAKSRTSGSSEPLVTSCPQCASLVRLPTIVSIEATLRCPVCHYTFALRSLLPDTIPEAEVVSELIDPDALLMDETDLDDASSARETPLAPLEKLVVNEVLRKGAKRNRQHHRRRSPNAESEATQSQRLDEAVTPKPVTSLPNEARTRSSHRRSSKSNRQWIEFVKIALGALLALPVAQLIIWWVLAIDPLGLAPRVGAVLPPVVPAKLRSLDEPN